MRLSGALQKKRTSEISYREIIKNSSNDDSTIAKQVKCLSGHMCKNTVLIWLKYRKYCLNAINKSVLEYFIQ